MKGASLEAAEAVVSQLLPRLRRIGGLRGIGIAVLDDGYGVKVNVRDRSCASEIPDDVDGVPVIVDVVEVPEAL